MFKALLKVQLASVIASLTRSAKGHEKRSAASGALIAVLFVFVVGVLVFACGAMFLVLAEPLHAVGLGWFYFALARWRRLRCASSAACSPPSSSYSTPATTSCCSPCPYRRGSFSAPAWSCCSR